MIKDDLAQAVATEFGISQNLAGRIVQTILDKLVSGLVSDGHAELRRFGVFDIRKQGPRVFTLPSGKKITRPAQKTVAFLPSPTLKRKLNPPPSPSTLPRKRRS